MNHSMINAFVSMQSSQKHLDVISNNIANVNTTGYKTSAVTFQDVLRNVEPQDEQFKLDGRMTPLGTTSGFGGYVSNIYTQFTQGSLQETGNEYDFALQGDAFFVIDIPKFDDNGNILLDANGSEVYETLYSRNGAFNLSIKEDALTQKAYLATAEGYPIHLNDSLGIMQLQDIPKNHKIVVNQQGEVFADPPQDNVPNIYLGQLRIANVSSQHLLQPVGESSYALPDMDAQQLDQLVTIMDRDQILASGVKVHQGFIEQSSVNLTSEMTNMLSAQRSYQLGAKALASADSMLNLATNIRG
ncbi:flagellar hook-basal body protein [Longirhabdus pacifica]|uniref:flagellar hook-basal body protein n=1 Tax=Longirhabdus pacifica TaxID=2305227 RepID=UPI00100874F9|nr:flagellar hook-basal body protein [Longirhabdus pacifica]